MKNNSDGMKNHLVVSHEEGLFARKALLAKKMK